ncbi:4-hydroxy-3-methylbut-2-en-1-yl diphosphate synthase [Spiroplasma turonicum]|uniref:4-hydroxy-3-methylbut-2-en-1-yl diphosphate synthase (flavodoxin) n=2 Tax=Spiroplasma turonicum TaxID=216946 RepID=A0A0K1P897_9MOLU|nr:flavodoxin-dependent (E)-4-hydroxy-3-methylbut-2-enyl-diphosphate synthase [Spiroplasma turonicum]AKU80122.1 4-hydroxy-3-methylbut-2-en-1-yl diphosphate synthase [Spiroplasma turonicum]ALX71122.1 4-hydroxy-3-methylbut-2-en-1-yl diphosphate synthase [Spiroplasma turonicum]
MMINRTKTRKVMVGNVQIGGNNKVVIQSMTTSKTHNINETLKQINELHKEGCEIVRVAVLGNEDAESLKELVLKSPLPIVADIHFNYKFALLAADAGCAKIRINPGNIGKLENTIAVVEKCKEKNIPIRIGINSGSLPKNMVEKYGWTAKAMVESLRTHIEILENLDFKDIIYSLKSTDPLMAIEAYTMASEIWDYPSHLGITEAGSLLNGTIKSSFGLGVILFNGIGSTIRISLSEDPIQEIKVAKRLLNSMGLYENIVEVIACPTCGRLEFDLSKVVKEIENYVEGLNFPLKIAILGCVVNGPGESAQADIGIAGGNKGGIIFKKGKLFKTVKQEELVPELKKLILEYYESWKNKIPN